MFDLFRTEQPQPKTLRPHQEKALAMVRESYRVGNRRIVVQMPTGAGKTITAAEIIKGARAKGNAALFTTPAISLIDQTVSAFEGQGITGIGVMQANHQRTDPLAKVQVATLQTLAMRDIPESALVIVDECHVENKVIGRMMAERPDVFFLGLSATPWRVGMARDWQDLVIPVTIGDLIEQGLLSQFIAFAPSIPDLTGVKTEKGDYALGQLEEVMGEAKIMGDVVQTWLERGERRPTLCFCVNRAHAAQVAGAFAKAGISAGYVDGKTDSVERELINAQFRAGEVQIICSVRTMTTGVDLPVSCIIDAAPTKSEMLHVQKIGRGLRVNPGTEDCLAADTDVLTDKGLCKIKDITLDHMVWDGVSFVHHSGAVCRGIRPVITYDGITGTPDHRVMTEHGWRTLDEAASRQFRIARTGIGGIPLRLSGDSFPQGGGERRQAEGGGQVRPLLQHAHGSVSQHSEAAGDEGVPGLQRSPACNRAEVAVCEVPGATGPLPESEVQVFCEIWRARDRVSVREPECCGEMDRGKFRGSATFDGARSDRQQRPLRAGQHSLGSPCGEHCEQPEVKGVSGAIHRIPAEASGGEVFRPLAGGDDPSGDDGCRDCSEVGGVPVEQSCEEVWDILNAGPLQRFTANGRLVHNCLILDHAGNSLRLGLVTDIHHEELKQGAKEERGKREKTERLPTKCPKCTALKVGRVCHACGHEAQPPRLESAEGELKQISGKVKQPTREDKQRFWSMALHLSLSRGKGDRMAKGLYKSKFGVWPRGLESVTMPPDGAFMDYDRSRRIAYAKRMEKERQERENGGLL